MSLDPPEPPPLAYALPDAADARIERIRRLFAWFTLGYAIVGAVSGGFMFSAYARVTQLGPSRFITPSASVLAAVPLLIGAILMLRGRDVGPMLIRCAALALWIASVLSNLARFGLSGASLPTKAYEIGLLLGTLLFTAVLSAFSVPALLFYLSFPLRRGVAPFTAGGRDPALDTTRP